MSLDVLGGLGHAETSHDFKAGFGDAVRPRREDDSDEDYGRRKRQTVEDLDGVTPQMTGDGNSVVKRIVDGFFEVLERFKKYFGGGKKDGQPPSMDPSAEMI